MSTVLYSNKALYADSGNIITQSDCDLFMLHPTPKLTKSSCQRVAIGRVGHVVISAEVLQELVDSIASNLVESYRKDTGTLKLLIDLFNTKYSINFSALVMTTVGNVVYRIDTNDKYEVSITTLRLQDTYALGSGFMFAYGAIAAQCTPLEAMDMAIKFDIYSKYPIHSIKFDELLPFIEEEASSHE